MDLARVERALLPARPLEVPVPEPQPAPFTAKIIPMPLYEYECTKCHHRFERIRKFSDRPITKCPDCGGKVEQLISAAAVQFKGSGWYVTDYAKKGSSNA